MTRKVSATDAVEILKRRYVGDDEKRKRALRRELVSAEVAAQVYAARKRAGLNQSQLARLVGTRQSVISRLEDAEYGGHSLKMLEKIASSLGENLDVRLSPAGCPMPGDAARHAVPEQVVDQCPVEEMRSRGWLPDWRTVGDIKSLLAGFLGYRGDLPATSFRRSHPSRENRVVLMCWLSKLEIEAHRIETPAFSLARLRKEIAELPALSRRGDGPVRAIEWLAKRGVRCLFIRHLSGTYLDGAVMVADDAKPVIGLTLRLDRLDNFWFTLLHEIGHIVRHGRELDERPILDEDIQKTSTGNIEQQANRFAEDAWVDRGEWRAFRERTGKFARLADIDSLAGTLGVAPALVAGRLRYELQDYTKYSRFLGRKGQLTSLITAHYPIY